LADIGGTNVRFAVQRTGEPARKLRRYRCDDFPDIVTAVRGYLRDAGLGASPPTVAAIAVAAPITGDAISMTNHPWAFSVEAVRRTLGLETLVAVNDFVAIAESIPFLKPDDRIKVGGGRARERMPIAVLGPGTGLGISALIPDDVGNNGDLVWHAIATEGGHATMAAANEREEMVLHNIRGRHKHVSVERCLSGNGLVNIHRALAEADGKQIPRLSPADVTHRAKQGHPVAREAVAMFCAMLGSTAGNLALTYGALGGVYIAGGIVVKLGTLFDGRLFRRRFTDKGRYRGYLAAIPTYVITHRLPALIGLAALLDRRSAAGSTSRGVP
jgi:glucokinase